MKDSSSIDQWFVDNQQQLKSYLFRLTTNRQDAEDLCQETYLKAKEKFVTFRRESSLKTWIYAIATNQARDHWRVRQRWPADAQDKCREAAESIAGERQKILDAFDHLPEKKFEVVEHISYCLACLSKNLTLEQQVAVILSEFLQFKRKEIAQVLQKTEGVVKHVLFQARSALQQRHFNRCALLNKEGVCYQCSELNDFFHSRANNGCSPHSRLPAMPAIRNFEDCLATTRNLDPLSATNAKLHETLLDVLQHSLTE